MSVEMLTDVIKGLSRQLETAKSGLLDVIAFTPGSYEATICRRTLEQLESLEREAYFSQYELGKLDVRSIDVPGD